MRPTSCDPAYTKKSGLPPWRSSYRLATSPTIFSDITAAFLSGDRELRRRRCFFCDGICALARVTRACRSTRALRTVSLSAAELLSCSIQSRCWKMWSRSLRAYHQVRWDGLACATLESRRDTYEAFHRGLSEAGFV